MWSLRADAAVGNGRCGTVLSRRRRQASPTWRLRRRQRTLDSDEKERVCSGHRLPHRTHGAVLACLSDRYARRPHTRRVTCRQWRRRTSEPMPFIGDDLLTSFDEDRTLAVLRLLAAAGQRQQIILTHHRHVVDLAKSIQDHQIDLIDL